MLKKKKILYIMHVNWGWAKQRPHFIAENLNNYYDVTVINPKSFIYNNLTTNNLHINIKDFYYIPYERFTLIRKLNYILFIVQFWKKILNSDIIWITFPAFYSKIKLFSKSKKIIYDCMDNVLEFPNIKSNKKITKEIFKNERELLKRSDLTFYSSESLKKLQNDRYLISSNEYVINNGLKIYSSLEKEEYNNENFISISKEFTTLTYIGTISNWFDYKTIEEILIIFPKLCLCLFGPVDHKRIEHPRIKYFGSVKHSQIFHIMENSSILIMPFIINDLIKTVNPVKLYEYILSTKPIIVSYYKEIEIFKDFINTYSTLNELIELIKNITNNNDIEKCMNFASKNTWENRGLQINFAIKNSFNY